MFGLLGLRLQGIKSPRVSDQLFAFLDSGKPQLTVNTGSQAEGGLPNSTYYIRGFSIEKQPKLNTQSILWIRKLLRRCAVIVI